ncbi:MAG: hypothetical protein HQL26_00905 [Candidatus Omnitrophica bacterium]|nr:hypothetical protein [Candidatus Omnitrophota bacterium]
MSVKNVPYKSIAFIIAVILVAQPKSSCADRGDRHFYRYHDRPHFGMRVSLIPDDYFTVSLGRSRYYYYDGLYYDQIGTEYVIVNPPIGAVVNAIPSDFQPIIINGMTYFTNNGIYYVYTPRGYQVVPQPVIVQPAPVIVNQQPVVSEPSTSPASTVTAAPASENTEDSFTVNIPNDKSGYTAVVIKRSANGFTGPQGEFYPEFPKVAQLKLMYGK